MLSLPGSAPSVIRVFHATFLVTEPCSGATVAGMIASYMLYPRVCHFPGLGVFCVDLPVASVVLRGRERHFNG